jgi:SAM-dependent methyltransferase
MFSKTAKYYDDIYASVGKDYPAEAKKAHRIIGQKKKSAGKRLLDVGCGTGVHAGLLGKYYQVEGLYLDRQMLSIARKHYPGMRFHQGDMVDFQLSRQFDAIVCLFSAIGYVRTRVRLRKAIKTMAAHLLPGGVLLVEPWFTPAQWNVGHISTTEVEKPGVKIIRMSLSSMKRNLSVIEFHYLYGTSKGIQHFVESHELGLFTEQDYIEAFRSAGLQVTHDPEGLDGRGLYVGTR